MMLMFHRKCNYPYESPKRVDLNLYLNFCKMFFLNPKNAITKQYKRLFDMEGVEIEFRENALYAVARKAMDRKTGARGLRCAGPRRLVDLSAQRRPPLHQHLSQRRRRGSRRRRTFAGTAPGRLRAPASGQHAGPLRAPRWL